MVVRRKKMLLLVSSLVLALVLTGCFGSPNTSSDAAYTIRGQIVDAETEEGLEGITVAVAGQSIVVTTDEEGRWTLEGLKGQVTIIPTAKGYIFDPISRTATFGTRGQSFDFVASKDDGTFPPDKEYSLFGKVTRNGEPFNDAIVFFEGEHISDGLSTLPGLGETPDGVWQQNGLKGPVKVSLIYNLPTCTFDPPYYKVDPNDEDFYDYRSKLDFEITCT